MRSPSLFLKNKSLALIALATLCAASALLRAEPSGFSFSDKTSADPDQRIWALIVIPRNDTPESQWMGAIERFPALRLNVALSPGDLARIAPSREALRQYQKSGRIEAALRLNGDPPLPLIYDLESVRPFLPAGLALPSTRMGWPEDVTGPIARARALYKNFFGEFPRGFVPGGGSLSLPVAETLRAQKFQWTVLGSSEPEWPAGETLNFQDAAQGTLLIFSEHPASRGFYSGAAAVENPVPEPALAGAVREMFLRIEEAHAQQTLPVVIYDERSARFPLPQFLEECSRQLKDHREFKMLLLSETNQQNLFRLSDSLQIWPYSWSWLKGNGDPSGPGLTAWIGDREKNAAWEILSRAREDADRYKNSGHAELDRLDRALEPLYLAESGDFFESFGASQTKPGSPEALRAAEQEKRFKSLLASVYRQIQVSVPEALSIPLAELPPAVQPDTTAARAPGSPAPKENTAIDLRIEQKKGSVTWNKDEPESSGPDLQRFSVQVSSNDQGETVQFLFGTRHPADGTVVDLYIDINHRDGAGSMSLLPGRRAIVDSADGWEYVLVSRFQSERWECRLFRGNSSSPIYHAAAPNRGGNFSVRVPKSLLGLDPLRWGYLVCIMGKETGSIADFLSPVTDKPKALADLKESAVSTAAPASRESAQAGIKVLLPMMRARP